MAVCREQVSFNCCHLVYSFVIFLSVVASTLCEYEEIHRVWPLRPNDLREHTKMSETEPEIVEPTEPGNFNRNASTRPILVYGSPICIGRCIILQIFWSNSSTSLFGVKLPAIPTFPRPRPIMQT